MSFWGHLGAARARFSLLEATSACVKKKLPKWRFSHSVCPVLTKASAQHKYNAIANMRDRWLAIQDTKNGLSACSSALAAGRN